jgi:hypothetical protein
MLVFETEADALWPQFRAEESYSAVLYHHHQAASLGIPATLTLSLWTCKRAVRSSVHYKLLAVLGESVHPYQEFKDQESCC